MDWHISILIDVINVGMCSNIAFVSWHVIWHVEIMMKNGFSIVMCIQEIEGCHKMHPFLSITSELVKITGFLCIQIF